jgi:amino acid adenylation domain-containing protein
MVAMVSGGCLRVQWLYSRAAHRSETIETAARRFGMALRYLLTGAALESAQAAVASDFPLADLDGDAVVQLLEASAPVADIWPLTPLQEGILVHALHDGDAGVYGQQVAVDLHGALDRQALHRAWVELARRHEMLRVEFRWRDLPGPRQVVQRETPIEMEFLDWSMNSAASQERRWKEWLGADRARGFNLACVPLWRATVIQLAEYRWRLVWSHHHLLLDGWSLPVVFRQLLELYSGAPAAGPPFNYRDYLAWLGKRDARAAAVFWKEYLAGYKPAGGLEIGAVPTASMRDTPAARASQRRELSPEATRALRELAQGLQVTMGACIQAVWALALARWTRQSDVVFGLVVSGRPPELPGVESAVGMFINTLPLRVRVPRGEPVGEWLRDLHRQTAQLGQFESSRLVDIQSCSEVPRGQSLFEALLIIENYPLGEVLGDALAGITFGKVETFEQTSLPLNLYAVPGGRLELRIEYDTARFFDVPIGVLADSVKWLLESLPSHAAAPVQMLTLAPPQAIDAIARAPIGDLVHRRVSKWAARTPARIAVAAVDGSLSYAELETRSNQLAHRLRAFGAGRGKLVGIRLDRSPEMVVALLGVLKSGAAYVPMDPAFPAERLAIMEADSGVGKVLTTVDLDENTLAAYSMEPLESDIDPAELAYVIFTSGSTGRPKGVQVTHGALSNFLTHFAANPGLSPEDVLLAVTTLSFDIAGLELFLPLVCGAQLAICPREIAADARGLASALSKSSATVMQATPATWRLLLTGDWHPSASTQGRQFQAWCGGEALPMDLAASLLDRGVTLWNFYGPTETTIWSTTQAVGEKPDAAFIGLPIANTLAYVLDEYFNPVPDGMPGELYLGGEGLARGYVGRPDLTAERFVPNPFGNGDRLYATGDSVRCEPGGQLRFLGRGDHQVKIRGFRIELEEIETALRTLPNVRAAAAAAREDRIVAYVVGLTEAGGAVSLRSKLRDRLPDYMVPAAFVELDKLPLTPNEKLDRRALPDPGVIDTAGAEFSAPRNAIEQVLADLWRELLGLSKAGARDHFFELGGHSLLAAQALARISKYFQTEIPLRTFFQTATPESVAAALTAVEPKPGHMLKIAAALLKIRSMSPEERARLRDRGTAVSAAG